tara:strand:- start:4339 stop:5070 length:732 start_codon:yes stop_codon:yes gene_type:complete
MRGWRKEVNMIAAEMAKVPPKRPTRPKHAASLVLLRGDSESPEVLLGRRPLTARFMPGVYVFPGGALERDDHAVASSLEFRNEVIDRVARHGGVRRARALTWTAIRETWEETGILVGREGQFKPQRSNPATKAFQNAGLVPAPAQLEYIVRAVTPTHSPIRFDTRFFLGDGNKSGGNLFETAELEDIGWHSLGYTLKQLNIMGVTQFVLEEAWRTWRQLHNLESNRSTPILMRRRGVRVIRRE